MTDEVKKVLNSRSPEATPRPCADIRRDAILATADAVIAAIQTCAGVERYPFSRSLIADAIAKSGSYEADQERIRVLTEALDAGHLLVTRLLTMVTHGKPSERDALDWLNVAETALSQAKAVKP